MLRHRLGSDEAKCRDPAGSVECLGGPEARDVHVQSTIQEVSRLETAGVGWNSDTVASLGGSSSSAARSRLGLTAYVFKQATLKYLKIIDTLSSLVHDVFNMTPCYLISNVFDCFCLGIGRLGGVYTMQEVGGFAG